MSSAAAQAAAILARDRLVIWLWQVSLKASSGTLPLSICLFNPHAIRVFWGRFVTPFDNLSDESERGRSATRSDVRASTAKSSPPVAGRHELTPSPAAGRGAAGFRGSALRFWERSPQQGSNKKQNVSDTSGVPAFADVDHEERRLWDRVRKKMKQRRASQELDEATLPKSEFAQQQQQQQDVLAGDETLAPSEKVSEWLSSSKSPSKVPARASARERGRAQEALSERQDVSGQGQPVSSLSRQGSLSRRGSHSRASPIPIGEDANKHDILQHAFQTHEQEVAVLRETIEILQLQVQAKCDSDADRESGRQGQDTPAFPAPRALRASFGATPDNKEQSPHSNHTTHEPDIYVLRETVKALKEDRQAQDSELLDALARVKSANISVLREEQQASAAGIWRKDVVGQCCRTMQVLAASVSELLDEKDSLKAELHSLQLSRRGDLLKVETELDILRDNCRKQQKALEDLEQAKELLHKKLLLAAENNLALESQVQQLEASQSDMRQVTKSMERQHIDDCATVKEMLEELERHRTANRELYSALVNARAASSTNGTARLLLHHPPLALSPPLPSFLLDDKGDRSPPILGPGVSPPRAARHASPPRIRGLTPPRLYETSLPQRRAAAAGDLWDVESLPPPPHGRPPKIEIALPSSALRERNADKWEKRRVGHGASTQIWQLPEPPDSVRLTASVCIRVRFRWPFYIDF
jgi:hypothetical protein